MANKEKLAENGNAAEIEKGVHVTDKARKRDGQNKQNTLKISDSLKKQMDSC